jgi:hypothetical protein
MKIAIEIPVDVDGELTAAEEQKLAEHLRQGIEPELQFLRQRLAPGARMLDTTCRFAFGQLTVEVK